VVSSSPLLTRFQREYIRELLLDRRVRAQNGAFVVEGAHAVRDLLTRNPEQILTIVTAYGYLSKEKQSDRLVRLASSTQQYSCPDLQFSKLSDLDAPQGILAVVRQPTWDEGEVLGQPTILGVFGEQLQDPANVGAIIRTAAALNASALWLTPESADVYHPKVVRATSGVVLALPIFAARDMSGLIRQGCQIFAAEVAGDKTRFLRQRWQGIKLVRSRRFNRCRENWFLLLVMKVVVYQLRSAGWPPLDLRSHSAAR